jgi:hypothetical protein
VRCFGGISQSSNAVPDHAHVVGTIVTEPVVVLVPGGDTYLSVFHMLCLSCTLLGTIVIGLASPGTGAGRFARADYHKSHG